MPSSSAAGHRDGWRLGAAVLVGWLRPAAWLLALLLAAILAAVWVFAVVRLFTAGMWGTTGVSGTATEPDDVA